MLVSTQLEIGSGGGLIEKSRPIQRPPTHHYHFVKGNLDTASAAPNAAVASLLLIV